MEAPNIQLEQRKSLGIVIWQDWTICIKPIYTKVLDGL